MSGMVRGFIKFIQGAGKGVDDTLFIKTGLEQKAWLEYILSEFMAIHSFQGKIRVVSQGEPLPDGASVVVYGREPGPGVRVPACSGILPSRHVQWLEQELYVVPGTVMTGAGFSLVYDLFWNAFVFLSGLEEELLSRRGKIVLSHGALHPRRDKATFLIPIVNVLFSRLEALLRKEFPHFVFGRTTLPVMDLSHDVDYLSKSPVFMIKQSILNVYDLVCSASRPRECFFSLAQAVKFLGRRSSAWYFDYWREFEKSMGVRSIFYIHAKVKKGPETWFIDPDYDLVSHRRLQEQLCRLIEEGFAIGLHGSFFSATDRGLMEQEKDVLEGILGQPVMRTRQHWLRFVHGVTPSIHEQLFAVDSTLGWNDLVGYRHGCASAFHPYDHVRQRAFAHREIPQVIMDFNVFQSLGLEDKEHVKQADELLRHFYQSRSAYVSVSWHQQTASPDYNWHGRYEQIVRQYVAKAKGDVNA